MRPRAASGFDGRPHRVRRQARLAKTNRKAAGRTSAALVPRSSREECRSTARQAAAGARSRRVTRRARRRDAQHRRLTASELARRAMAEDSRWPARRDLGAESCRSRRHSPFPCNRDRTRPARGRASAGHPPASGTGRAALPAGGRAASRCWLAVMTGTTATVTRPQHGAPTPSPLCPCMMMSSPALSRALQRGTSSHRDPRQPIEGGA